MAGQGTVSIATYKKPLGQKTIPFASLGAAFSLSSIVGGVPANTKIIYFEAEGGDIRYNDDGNNPTATLGQRVYDGQTIEYTGLASALKFLAVSGAPQINVSFYG